MELLLRKSVRVFSMDDTLFGENFRNELENLIMNASSTRQKLDSLGSSWFVVPTKASVLKAVTDEEHCRRAKSCGENFFEYFLDGTAGVMYTSFLGLIISEILKWNEGGSDHK